MMAQILSPIDLRSPDERAGFSKSERLSQSLSGIFQAIGKSEEARREREQLDRISRAIAGGASTVEAIQAAAAEPTQFSPGLRGGLQKFAGAFQPGGGAPSGTERSIFNAGLQGALAPPPLLSREEERDLKIFGQKDRPGEPSLLTPEQEKEAALIEAGLKPRASATAAAGVDKPTAQQTQRDRDLSTVGSDTKTPFQKNEARERLDKDPSQPRNPIEPGGTYEEFLDNETKENGKFDEAAYNTALTLAQDEARIRGGDPESLKQDFDRWWDEQVKESTGNRESVLRRLFGGVKGEFVPRGLFLKVPETPKKATQSTTDDVTQLSDEQLQEALAQIGK